jgi:hypothetical protein
MLPCRSFVETGLRIVCQGNWHKIEKQARTGDGGNGSHPFSSGSFQTKLLMEKVRQPLKF